jgi:hypothetical protein
MPSSSQNVIVLFIVFLLVSPMTSNVAPTPHHNGNSLSFLQQGCPKLSLNEDYLWKLDKASSLAIYTVAAAASVVGFTIGGISAGSRAAWYQIPYKVGMAFSWLQSMSITGAAATVMEKVGAAIIVVKSYFVVMVDRRN